MAEKLTFGIYTYTPPDFHTEVSGLNIHDLLSLVAGQERRIEVKEIERQTAAIRSKLQSCTPDQLLSILEHMKDSRIRSSLLDSTYQSLQQARNESVEGVMADACKSMTCLYLQIRLSGMQSWFEHMIESVLQLPTDELRELTDAVAVPPLVVVPAEDFAEI